MGDITTAKGHCLCGAVTIHADQVSTHVGACHCSMCRRWGGGPLMVVDCGSEVRFSGDEHIRVFDSSEWAQRGFCEECGSHLFYLLKEPQKFLVPVGLLDLAEKPMFDHQVFIDNKPEFYAFANETNDMTEAEVFAKFAP